MSWSCNSHRSGLEQRQAGAPPCGEAANGSPCRRSTLGHPHPGGMLGRLPRAAGIGKRSPFPDGCPCSPCRPRRPSLNTSAVGQRPQQRAREGRWSWLPVPLTPPRAWSILSSSGLAHLSLFGPCPSWRTQPRSFALRRDRSHASNTSLVPGCRDWY